MPEPFASVLIPTRAPGRGIEEVLDAVFQQRPGFDFEVLIVDSGSADSDLERMRSFPLTLHSIPPGDFGHGRTRNLLARLARGQVFLFLSQDAQPASSDWMELQVEPLSDELVAGAYARQLPKPGTSLLNQFFLLEMYGDGALRRRLGPEHRASIGDIFFSNASAGIKRDVWQRIPFRDDVAMSEDQYWAYDVLRAGYCIAYEPRAQVYHSHEYNLRTLFLRNCLSGRSLRGLVHDSALSMSLGWMRYVRREIAFLRRQHATRLLPYALVYELDRAAGFCVGTLASSMGCRSGRRATYRQLAQT